MKERNEMHFTDHTENSRTDDSKSSGVKQLSKPASTQQNKRRSGSEAEGKVATQRWHQKTIDFQHSNCKEQERRKMVIYGACVCKLHPTPASPPLDKTSSHIRLLPRQSCNGAEDAEEEADELLALLAYEFVTPDVGRTGIDREYATGDGIQYVEEDVAMLSLIVNAGSELELAEDEDDEEVEEDD